MKSEPKQKKYATGTPKDRTPVRRKITDEDLEQLDGYVPKRKIYPVFAPTLPIYKAVLLSILRDQQQGATIEELRESYGISAIDWKDYIPLLSDHDPEVFNPAAVREQVKKLVGIGITHESIAGILGISVSTLVKHYKDEIAYAHEKKNALVANALLTNAVENMDTKAQIFYLKARANWDDKVAPVINNTNEVVYEVSLGNRTIRNGKLVGNDDE